MKCVPERAIVATLSDVFISPKLYYFYKIQALAKTINDLHDLIKIKLDPIYNGSTQAREGSNLWIEKICRKRSKERCVRV